MLCIMGCMIDIIIISMKSGMMALIISVIELVVCDVETVPG